MNEGEPPSNEPAPTDASGDAAPTKSGPSHAKKPPRRSLKLNATIVAALIMGAAAIVAAIIGLSKPQGPVGGPGPVPTSTPAPADPAAVACGKDPYERTYTFDEVDLAREPQNWIQTGDRRALYEQGGRLHLASYLGEPGAPEQIESELVRQPPDVPLCMAEFTFTVDKAADTQNDAQFVVYDHEGRTQRVVFGPGNNGGGFEYWICSVPRCDDKLYSAFDHPGGTYVALGQPVTIRFLADGQRLSVYTQGKLVASVPSAGWFTGAKFYISAATQVSWQTSVDDVHVKTPRL